MPDIYRDLDYTADQVDEAIQTIGSHVANNAIHVNQSEKDSWNAKADSSALSAETSAREAADTALQTAVNSKADASALTSEISARETADASIISRISAIETDQQRQDAAIEAGALRYEDSGIIRLNQLSWSQTSSGSGMWVADCYTTQNIDTIVSVLITSFGALKPAEIKTLFTYIPLSVSGMHTVRLVCDQSLASISSNPTLYLRVFGYGYQAASLQSAPASLMQAGRLDAAEQTNINDPISDSDM